MTPQLRRHARLDLGGSVGGVLFFCLSLTPSLLPRSWAFQGIVSGIVTAIGYGLGAGIGAVLRGVIRAEASHRARRMAWRVLAVGGSLLVLVFLYLGSAWQQEISRLVGVPPPPRYLYLATLVLAGAILVMLVAAARTLRWLTRLVAEVLGRFVPDTMALAMGILLVGLLTLGLLDGVVWRGFLTVSNNAFKVANGETSPGTSQPTSPYVSGGPGSLVSWSSLGNEGRTFVTGAPGVAALRAFNGAEPKSPIRVYAGLDAARSMREQIRLAVGELDRTHAFERRVLCVMVGTGTGWIDPRAAKALEYLYNGDSALVSVQYSYLPSWISFMVDRSRAAAAGRELFDQVYARWSALPAGHRPRLLVFGESLGAFGAESAFNGLDDMRRRTDGVLLVGPPNSSELWAGLTGRRDAGTPQRLPRYGDGSAVQFAATPADLAGVAGRFSGPGVVYLQHASDPIVWWSPRLAVRRPDWLHEARGGDVTGAMRWYPFVTFWQVTADLVEANRVPSGHGHRYGVLVVDAWVALAAPDGWTSERTDRLRALLRH